MAETETGDGVNDAVLELCWEVGMVREEGGGEAAVRMRLSIMSRVLMSEVEEDVGLGEREEATE